MKISDVTLTLFAWGGIPPTTYGRLEHAEAEPALPGWSMPVADIFPPA